MLVWRLGRGEGLFLIELLGVIGFWADDGVVFLEMLVLGTVDELISIVSQVFLLEIL